MIIELIFLPALFFIGAITSYQDFRSGKIKNKWIKAGLLWGVFGYLMLFLWFKLSSFFPDAVWAGNFSSAFSVNFFIDIAINSLISLAVGYLLWHFKLWAAGDAKLFFVFSLLLPLKYYSNGAFPHFPSLALLLNVFTFAFIFLILRSLYFFFKELDTSSLKFGGEAGILGRSIGYIRKNYITLVKTVVIFFMIIFIFQLMRFKLGSVMNISGNQQVGNVWLVLIFVGLSRSFSYFKRLMEKTWILVLIYLAIIPYFWLSGFFSSSQNIASILALVKHSILFSLFFSPIFILLAYVQKNKDEKSMPFAIWLLAGVIATMIFRGAMFSFFAQLVTR
ncbi:MAG: hypothetical protein WC726_00480 [Parcubacteria group bacterium]|jgi:hypothetical protein